MKSVFEQYEPHGYPYKFHGKIYADIIAGGTPTNPEVAEAWIRSKGFSTAELKDELIREEVARVMEERGVSMDQAVEEVSMNRHLNGFKRDDNGLYIEGRQLKANLKEAGSVAADAGKLKARGYGEVNSRKGIQSFIAEHIFVIEQKLYLGVQEPTRIIQQFVHTFRGNGIQYNEVVEDIEFDFTVETDREYEEEEWAMLWLTGQRQGIGACRSQGYGRYTLTEWSQIEEQPTSKNGSKREKVKV